MKKLNVTQGEWKPRKSYDTEKRMDIFEIDSINHASELATVWTGGLMTNAEAEANAILIADAGTTYNKCGKLPSELLEERNELVEALKESIECFKIFGYDRISEDFKALLTKIENNQTPQPNF